MTTTPLSPETAKTGRNTAENIGLVAGPVAMLATLIFPAPLGMADPAWAMAGLTLWMATWWMTQALPLTATALLPFLVMPLTGVMDVNTAASKFYSPILFLILGGAFLALAIERTGLHKRLALAIIRRAGSGSSISLMLAFMIATALLSMLISNTSTTLIMVPIAVAVLAAGGVKPGETEGFAGALLMGIAFAASIGGLGTLVGSPTNAIAAGLINETLSIEVTFVSWASYGLPVVVLGIPICALILARVQRLGSDSFDVAVARTAIGYAGAWTLPEKRLVPVILFVVTGWLVLPLVKPQLPAGALHDGSIAIIGGLLLFILPDGTGRPLLVWKEANRAPWGVIMMFGGGLALAAGIIASGLADWLGAALEPLSAVPLLVVAVALVGLVILVTEFASNVATASGIMPVVASLILAMGVDPVLLAMPAALAASWGFMLPSGTGPNAIAWASDHISLPRMLKAGFLLDVAGVPLMVGAVWLVATLV
ncbi:SLC13 family permease [Alterisphingorhabdus coralli]|uniref:DASS family sodium-coupled anion symporter n=1 Tax=Alterisphingorhabdus coralli TaxID=3071408 RepID=A0AA97F6J0_9SPHN|nr:DASS family sodium-coupled anion symporter [Parasphingorhabdus sp. SCSIO 66989]WOE75279.1 DASS family sodium-coupled anion symporter [Parasphingorhabdus sp. SCSIO 66989]